MENKKQKFVRLANNRVNKTLKQLDLVGNLSNKNAYDYSQAEVEQIIDVLNDKVKELETQFSKGLSSKKFEL